MAGYVLRFERNIMLKIVGQCLVDFSLLVLLTLMFSLIAPKNVLSGQIANFIAWVIAFSICSYYSCKSHAKYRVLTLLIMGFVVMFAFGWVFAKSFDFVQFVYPFGICFTVSAVVGHIVGSKFFKARRAQ